MTFRLNNETQREMFLLFYGYHVELMPIGGARRISLQRLINLR